jgi:hypothetical protein
LRRLYLMAGLASLPMLSLLGCSANDRGACRTDSYPALPAGAPSALYVSTGCPREGADGTPERPYATVSEALAAASPGAAVLVAPGTYAEHLNITQGVVLVGSSDADHADAAAAIVSPGVGSFLGCEGRQTSTAINICDARGVTLRGIRVSNAVAAGIKVSGGDAIIEGSVVENTALEGEQYGHGVIVANAGSIILQHSAVTGSAGVGVFVTGAGAIILQNTIRDSGGPGLRVDSAQGDVAINGNVIENNTQLGVGVFGSRAIILQNQIRGTRLDPEGIGDGFLASALSGENGAPLAESDVELQDNEISGNARVGALFTAAAKSIILQHNTVADNASSTAFGAGVWLQGGAGNDPSTRIEDNDITANRFIGIGVTGDTRGIILQNNRILATTAKATFIGVNQVSIGDGIGLFMRASATVRSNQVSGNERFGLIMDTADGETTVIESNRFEQNDDSAIILQNQAQIPPTDFNTFDAADAVRSVPSSTFEVRSEDFDTKMRLNEL